MMTTPMPPSGGQRPKSPTRLVVVEAVRQITPRVTCVTFTGEALRGFGPPRPGAHMKLLFVPPTESWSPDDELAPRPPRRTYTPRRFDPARLLLDIEFVHHGDGLAAQWASHARAGDNLYINGPGGGYDVPDDAGDVVLIADDTALPAAGTILESIGNRARVSALCEVYDQAERRPLSPAAALDPTWLFRNDAAGKSTPRLEEAVENLQIPIGSPGQSTYWWIACEAGAMRRIRRRLLDRGISPDKLHTRGYWKAGEVAYPDHDYGKD